MLKGLAILAIAAFVAVSVTSQPNKAVDQKQQPAKQGQPAILSADSQNKQANGQTNQPEASSNPPTRNATIERPHWWATSEWWLVIIAGLTGCVIGWQSWETRKSAKSGQNSAKAALLNAQALVNAERAWVLILREKTQKPYLVPLEKPFAGGPRLSHCIVWLKNFGNSPAKIVNCKFELQIGDNRIAPPRTDFFELKSLEFDKTPIVMPQQEEWPFEGQLIPDGIIREEQLKSVLESKTKFLWFCAIIHYRDVFEESGSLHDSKICFLYETFTDAKEPFWILGPAAYNQAK